MDKFVYKTLVRHTRKLAAMSETLAELQKVVAEQGELLKQEQAQGDAIEAIVKDQAEAIADLEAALAGLPGVKTAVEAEVEKIKAHNVEIQDIVTTEPEVNPTPPGPERASAGSKPSRPPAEAG